MSERSEPGGPAVTLTGGVRMPLVGFGTWRLRGREAYDAVRAALDAGYRHLDTATFYGNEAEIGRAVADSRIPREQVFITTKLPPERAGREDGTLAESLHALRVEYVDLWLIHWPPAGRAAPQVWQRLLAAREAGKARAVGVSNYETDQLDELIETSGQPPAVNQIPWSPGRYDADVLAQARERGVAVEGYSPLKNTNLRDPVLTDIARAHRVDAARVVLRWHLEHGIAVIPKSARRDRIRANFDLFGFSLTGDEVARIDGLSRVFTGRG